MHILTPSSTVRRIVNMTALAVVDAGAQRAAAPAQRLTRMNDSVLGAAQRGAAKTARIPIRVEIGARRLPKPDWIRVRVSQSERFREVKRVLREAQLHTVCEEASCPNIGECFGKGTATFMVLGDLCTRRCPFCDVAHGRPLPPDPLEAAAPGRHRRAAAA